MIEHSPEPNKIGRRDATKGITLLVSSVVLSFLAACRRALSPATKESMDNRLAAELIQKITEEMKTPPAAMQDTKKPERFTVTLRIEFPELTEVPDGAMSKAQDGYNDPKQAKKPRKSKVLTWRRIDPRTFSVDMEFSSEAHR